MKEQMARNFLRVLGPFSEPVLIASLEPNTTASPLNLTFLWIDPAGHLAEVSEMHIEEGMSVGQLNSFKPSNVTDYSSISAGLVQHGD